MEQADLSNVVRLRRWHEADARIVLTAFQASGKDVLSFSKEIGLKPERIWHWAARFRKQSSPSMTFHPVRIVGSCPGNGNGTPIEVVLLDGRRVRVPEGFAAADLARVLAVLAGTATC
jgi:hypothetical protein